VALAIKTSSNPVLTDRTNGEEQFVLAHSFRHVYRFILAGVNGDAAAAKAIFERYLAGELSEELLTISRQWVRADLAARTTREAKAGDGGGCDALVVVS
jgi:hypothetical protein